MMKGPTMAVRANRIRKSIGAENTFATDHTDFGAMAVELQPLVDKVWLHDENTSNRGRTVTLKVKFADFEIMSRSQSFPATVSSRDELERVSVALLARSTTLRRKLAYCHIFDHAPAHQTYRLVRHGDGFWRRRSSPSLDQVIDRTGRDALNVGFLYHRGQRLLGHPARLLEAGEI